MHVTQHAKRLQLEPKDHLLNVGCGDAALASRMVERIVGDTRADFSSDCSR